MAIDHSKFMEIYLSAELWSSWASNEALVKAAKVIGITASGLSVNWMQQDKFERPERCLCTFQSTQMQSLLSSQAQLISSPQDRVPVNITRKNWRTLIESSTISESQFPLETFLIFICC